MVAIIAGIDSFIALCFHLNPGLLLLLGLDHHIPLVNGVMRVMRVVKVWLGGSANEWHKAGVEFRVCCRVLFKEQNYAA